MWWTFIFACVALVVLATLGQLVSGATDEPGLLWLYNGVYLLFWALATPLILRLTRRSPFERQRLTRALFFGAAPMIPTVPSVSVPVEYKWIVATSVDHPFPSILELLKFRCVWHFVEYRDAHLYEFDGQLIPSVAAMPVLLVAFQVPLFIVCDTAHTVVMHGKYRRVRWDRLISAGHASNAKNEQCNPYVP